MTRYAEMFISMDHSSLDCVFPKRMFTLLTISSLAHGYQKGTRRPSPLWI